MTRDEILRLLGPTCERGPETLRFCSEEKGCSTPKQKLLFRQKWGEGDYETFDIFRWIHVTFRNGRAVAIRVDSSIT
jgi:hypothetical protein